MQLIIYGKRFAKISDALCNFNIEPIFLKDIILTKFRKGDIAYDFISGDFSVKSIGDFLHISILKIDIKLIYNKDIILIYENNNMLNNDIDTKITDEIANELFLKKIESLKNRNASFECTVTFYDYKHKKTLISFSKVRGTISKFPRGRYGKGIEKIFIPAIDASNLKTLAEMDNDEKKFKNPLTISLREIIFKIFLVSLNEYVKENTFYENDMSKRIYFKESVFNEITKSLMKLKDIQKIKVARYVYRANNLELSALVLNIYSTNFNSTIYILLNQEYSSNLKRFITEIKHKWNVECDIENQTTFDINLNIWRLIKLKTL